MTRFNRISFIVEMIFINSFLIASRYLHYLHYSLTYYPVLETMNGESTNKNLCVKLYVIIIRFDPLSRRSNPINISP